MNRYKYLLAAVVSALAVAAFAPQAWAAESAYSGRVLIDVSRHGEAWYVSPVTGERTYLGRPQEAVARLAAVATRIGLASIQRLPESDGLPKDEERISAHAGYVLGPNDAVGAFWYVDPVLRLRRRLATADDAWQIMRAGTPVNAAVLAAIPVAKAAPVTEEAACVEVMSADTLKLKDGRRVRLLNVDTPSNPELQDAAKTRLSRWCDGKTLLTLERDAAADDADGRLPRHAFASGAYLNLDLVANGLAFHNIASPNYKYAEQMVVAGLDAQRHMMGFWKK